MLGTLRSIFPRSPSPGGMPRMKLLMGFTGISLILFGICLIICYVDSYRTILRFKPQKTERIWTSEAKIVYRQLLKSSKRLNFHDSANTNAITTSPCEFGYQFRLLILVEEEELDLFMTKLKSSNYYDCQVNLQFIIIGNESKAISEFLAQLEWPYGKLFSHVWSPDSNRAIAMIESWYPEDKEFAIVFDRLDISVNPSFFKFALASVGRYYVGKEGRKLDSLIIEKVAGVSFSVMPLPTKERLALIQVPGEVMVFPPWFWQEVLAYNQWRQENGSLQSFPETTTSPYKSSIDSWKLILWEFMLIKGMVMLHPTKTSITDTVSTKRIGNVDRLIRAMKSLNSLPLIDSQGKRIERIEELRYQTMNSTSNIYPGYFLVTKRCILDEFSDPNLDPPGRPRYLIYEPHGDVATQIETLHKALMLSNLLNRTLIIPPLINPANPADTVAFNLVYSITFYWLKISTFETFQFFTHKITRHVLYKTRKMSYRNLLELPSAILKPNNIDDGKPVILPLLNATDAHLINNLAGCNDDILAFRHFNHLIESFQLPQATENLLKLRQDWSLRHQLLWFLQDLKYTKWPKPLVCTIYSRGDGEHPCGVAGEDQKDDKSILIEHLSCRATPARVLEYTVEAANKAGIAPTTIYLMQETLISEELPRQTRGITVFSAITVAEGISKERSLDIPQVSSLFVAHIVERELCLDAALFVNNIFSPLGNLISEHRKAHNWPTTYLGQTD